MQGFESNRKRREDFKFSIRRQQIDKLFQAQRKRLMLQNFSEMQDELQKQLESREKREFWIQERSSQLLGVPKTEWLPTMNSLARAIRFFENDFDDWITKGIISRMCLLFQRKYRGLRLSSLAAKIITELFYNFSSDDCFTQKIMKYNFVKDLVELLDEKEHNPEAIDIIEYLILISALANSNSEIRDIFVRVGVVQAIYQLSLRQTQNIEFTDILLTTISSLLKMHTKNGKAICPPRNLIQMFISYLDKQIGNPKSHNSLKQILQSLQSIVFEEKELNYTTIFTSKNIPTAILKHITSPDIEFRLNALTICSFLFTSSKVSSIHEFIRMGVLDQLWIAKGMTEADGKCSASILKCLSNLAANSHEDVEQIINHKIFQFIVSSAHPQNSQKVVQEAVYIINTMCITGIYNVIQIMIKDVNILDVLIRAIQGKKSHADIVLESLTALCELVKFYNHIVPDSRGNQITFNLLQVYNFDNLLLDLSEHHQSLTVRAVSDKIISGLQSNTIEDL